MFADIAVPDNITVVKRTWQEMVQRMVYDKFPDSEYQYILFHQGMGETMAFFFLLPEFRKKCKKKLVFFTYSQNIYDILQRSAYVDVIVNIPVGAYAYIENYELGVKNGFIGDFLQLHYMTVQPAQIQNNGFINKVKLFLGLDQRIPFKKYMVYPSSQDSFNAENEFRRLGLHKGKAVFLVLGGNAFPITGYFVKFWCGLIDKLIAGGYDVVVNSKEKIVSNVPNVFLPFWETVSFAAMCGHIVSASSGITEAVCTMLNQEIDVSFIWPSSDSKYWKDRIDLFIYQIMKYGNDFIALAAKRESEYNDCLFGMNIRSQNLLVSDRADSYTDIYDKIINHFAILK